MTQRSHRHHYVPIWYQKGFLGQGHTSFKRLDKRPVVLRDANNKVRGQGRAVLTKSPDAVFWESDLYTIRWLGCSDEVIERQLILVGDLGDARHTVKSRSKAEQRNVGPEVALQERFELR